MLYISLSVSKYLHIISITTGSKNPNIIANLIYFRYSLICIQARRKAAVRQGLTAESQEP